MKVSEMIAKLQFLQWQNGDLEVLITDGYNSECYRGDYDIAVFQDLDTVYIDIGIGGCKEE